MYTIKRICHFNIMDFNAVCRILNDCGLDMASKYNLHHWDNPYIKTLIIVFLRSLKNNVYLVKNDDTNVATFQTRKQGSNYYFEKLGTSPAMSGKGIGSFCMDQIEKQAVYSGCNKVTMEVYELSQRAIDFYNHRGYKIVGYTGTLKYKVAIMERKL